MRIWAKCTNCKLNVNVRRQVRALKTYMFCVQDHEVDVIRLVRFAYSTTPDITVMQTFVDGIRDEETQRALCWVC